MKACDNCTVELPHAGTRTGPPWRDTFPLGEDRGTQRDPYTATLDLCGPCQENLGGMIGGPVTPVDLDAFVERRLVALGHFTCRETNRKAAELVDRGFRVDLRLGPDPFADPGVIDTTWSVRTVGAPGDLADGAVPGVDIRSAVEQAYAAARADGWPEDRT